MKITALEIRQKAFEKEFRGYKKDEVDAFLLALSSAWESMVGETKELKLRLEQAEKEVQKLREVEDSLFKTLKTAETTGANMVEQANKSAELLMKETKLKAEQLYNDAQNKSDMVISRMQNEIRELEQDYRAIENQRDTLIREIRSLSMDTMERIDKVSSGKKDLSHIRERAQNLGAELRKDTSMHEPLKEFKTPSLEVPKPQPIIPTPTPASTDKKEEEPKETPKNEVTPTETKKEDIKEKEEEPKKTPPPTEEVKAPEIEEVEAIEEASESIEEVSVDADDETAEEDEENQSSIVFGEPEHSNDDALEEEEETMKNEESAKEDNTPEPTKKENKPKNDGASRSFFDEISD